MRYEGNISPDAVIYPGCRILGEQTSIGPGCEIGAESPVTIENCQLSRNVKLKGGYYSHAVFWDGAHMGSGAHVRAGTILEEKAGGAHTVGLKQTILLPFVTLGSLINFCDILMAGGTSRKNHSEVGSSYIHFNYTPHQDKATASLVGDVPRGVFLDQKPIFLGGQGGLVGPARIEYGTVIAAGCICRKDIEKPGQLHIFDPPKGMTVNYETGVYRSIRRIVRNNLIYIGNIVALREWYCHVRVRFVRDEFDQAVVNGGLKNLDLVLTERIRRLNELAEKMEYSSTRVGIEPLTNEQRRFVNKWPEMREKIENARFRPLNSFIQSLGKPDAGYLESVQSLAPPVKEEGRQWLQSIVDEFEGIMDYES